MAEVLGKKLYRPPASYLQLHLLLDNENVEYNIINGNRETRIREPGLYFLSNEYRALYEARPLFSFLLSFLAFVSFAGHEANGLRKSISEKLSLN